MKLSVLIPSLISRAGSLNALKNELNRQAEDFPGQVEIKTYVDNGAASIGDKRNDLLKYAKGEYICFIDDDDEVSKDYLRLIFEKIRPDCCSLTGVITWDGEREELFEHSIKYNAYRTNKTGKPEYERYPNHLNVIRKDIAQKFSFPSVNQGEDTDWATQIFKAGVLKVEAYINEILYHYKFKTKK